MRGGDAIANLLRLRASPSAAVPTLHRAYTAAIEESRNWADGIGLLRQMVAEDNLPPNTRATCAAMTACRRAGRWPLALQLLSELRDAGVAPTVYTASNGIAACEQGGRWELALQLLGELQSATPRVEPNVVVYNAALAALAKGAQSERALQLLDEMKAAAPRLEPNARTYSAAITACSRAGDWEAALDLWRELEGAVWRWGLVGAHPVWAMKPPINGKELSAELGLPKGPAVGLVLRELTNWQLIDAMRESLRGGGGGGEEADAAAASSRAAALEHLRQWINSGELERQMATQP